MRERVNKHALFVAGLSTVVLLGTTAVYGQGSPRDLFPTYPTLTPPAKKVKKTPITKVDKPLSTAPIATGILHIIVSIDKQRATLFANGTPVASTPVSTGTKSHPTPMGFFTILQKNRHHVSNLYNAAMPYMQRITWSGAALHQGPLPGYPASHGCIRLSTPFADMLWRTTKMHARVVVTRPDVAPVEFSHPKLFGPKPKVAELAPAVFARPAPAAGMIKTADGRNLVPGAVVPDATPEPVAAAGKMEAVPAEPPQTTVGAGKFAPTEAAPAEVVTGTVPVKAAAPAAVPLPKPAPANAKVPETPRPVVTEKAPAAGPIIGPGEPDARWTMTESVAGARDVERRISPVSVFISRKDMKLYVRQGQEPVFDMPITIKNPTQPIGTHLFTAMEIKDETVRWTAVTIPSGYAREVNPPTKKKSEIKTPPIDHSLASNASTALDRVDLPEDAVARITAMMAVGSSLIVSDSGIGHETGRATDFIVLTR